jgi:phenylacetate-CoA ligase
MLIIRGVNVFPTQVESVLLMSPEVEPHYQLIVEREGSMDTLSVEVEINCDLYKEAKEAILSDDDFVVLGEYDSLRDLRNQIKCNIKDIVGVTADIRLREPGAIERSEGKSKRVIDKRPK